MTRTQRLWMHRAYMAGGLERTRFGLWRPCGISFGEGCAPRTVETLARAGLVTLDHEVASKAKRAWPTVEGVHAARRIEREGWL